MSCLKTENPKCPGVDSDSGACCALCNAAMRRRTKVKKSKERKIKYGRSDSSLKITSDSSRYYHENDLSLKEAGIVDRLKKMNPLSIRLRDLAALSMYAKQFKVDVNGIGNLVFTR